MYVVSMPIIAAGLAELRHGRFSFYPAIVGVQHNEWILRRATWTEVLVANAKTSEEICIPRRFVGEVSSIEAPYRIVGLVKELEYREGVVLPHRRVVLEMPRAVGDFSRSSLRPTLYPRPAGSRGNSGRVPMRISFPADSAGIYRGWIPGLPRGDLRGSRRTPRDGLRLDLGAVAPAESERRRRLRLRVEEARQSRQRPVARLAQRTRRIPSLMVSAEGP